MQKWSIQCNVVMYQHTHTGPYYRAPSVSMQSHWEACLFTNTQQLECTLSKLFMVHRSQSLWNHSSSGSWVHVPFLSLDSRLLLTLTVFFVDSLISLTDFWTSGVGLSVCVYVNEQWYMYRIDYIQVWIMCLCNPPQVGVVYTTLPKLGALSQQKYVTNDSQPIIFIVDGVKSLTQPPLPDLPTLNFEHDLKPYDLKPNYRSFLILTYKRSSSNCCCVSNMTSAP